MKDIFRCTLDMIAQWPSEKFEKLAPYMQQEMKDADFKYLLDRREAISAYDNTHPRTTGFTLIKR